MSVSADEVCRFEFEVATVIHSPCPMLAEIFPWKTYAGQAAAQLARLKAQEKRLLEAGVHISDQNPGWFLKYFRG